MNKFILHGIDDICISEENEILNKDSENIYCLGLCLNSGCMYDCLYCYAKGNKPYSKNEQLSLEEYIDLINEAAGLGCKTVIITGVSSPSEPLLSPLLLPIIKQIYTLDMTTLIYTNAVVLGDNSLCKKIHNVSSCDLANFFFQSDVSLMISCDSINENNYNTIVRNKSFNIFQEALENLLKNQYMGIVQDGTVYTRVAISTVISKVNVNELQEIATYFHKLNWQYICKFPSLMGNAKKFDQYFFTPEEVINLRAMTSVKYTDKRETLVLRTQIGHHYCLANQLGIAVNGKGQILSCLSGEVVFDDSITVRNTSLKDLILAKKNKFGLNADDCPKKKKFYKN